MTLQDIDLTGLLGSRICHDLISPIGAIDNGLELLAMGGGTAGPELDLISGSVTNAKARTMYYRISFGVSDPQQTIGKGELAGVIAAYTSALRMNVSLRSEGDLPRHEAKLACLLLLCCETAMPFGGQVEASFDGTRWYITGQAEKLNIDPEIWEGLTGGDTTSACTPKLVHFILAAQQIERQGRAVLFEHTPQGFSLQV